MNPYLRIIMASAAAITISMAANAEHNPQSIKDLLDRIGGQGASAMIETEVDASISANGKETFTITSSGNKPFIKASSLSALTTGINWYLNHTAHENLTWNRLTTTFTSLPTPSAAETHSSAADYRYYLNYCTFSYSMSTWTWERWEQEIDYMALHGINMPLQIVGLDVVWRNMLTKDYGYSKDEADSFIAGPCFQAWWGMNNLEGWGGKNPDWWYDRQEQLAKKILTRMRELGIEPVLPGFAGMVPHDFTAKTGLSAIAQGGWCGFTRPYILNPETEAFKQVAEKYYARLEELMGTSKYYSMDPFHEGANTSGIANIGNAYKAIYEAMDRAKSGSKWVIQQWQWSGQQYSVLDNVPKGRLVVLDLFSDGNPKLGSYKGHDVVYCALPNFGGRTGFFGRFNGMINGYFDQKASISAIKGIGATPEAIEQAPVLYDLLFELPWHSSKPDPENWMSGYATSRYGKANNDAAEAWELLRNSALNCTSGLQGPHEAVMCARPAWVVNSVSTWGGSTIFYNPDDVANAAYHLLNANLSGENYSYDLTDITRQALTDYSNYLLKAINEARQEAGKDFTERKTTFLNLFNDLDELLATNSNFMVGKWTQMARDIANESSGTTESDKNWLELNNARTLITTWGERNNSEGGGLRDYSYRQWNGMLKDYYRPRWEKFFAGQNVDWYANDHAWAMNASVSYSNVASGNTHTKAGELLRRYLPKLSDRIVYRSMVNDFSDDLTLIAYRGEKFTFPLESDEAEQYFIAEGPVSANGSAMIAKDAPLGDYDATATFGQTVIRFKLSVRDQINSPRTITATSANPAQGSASIEGSTSSSVTSKEPGVTLTATASSGFKFSHWSIDNEIVSTDNPYTYYGAGSVTITANFVEAPTLVAGDITLKYETTPVGAIVITGIDSGKGHADLAYASTPDAPIVAITEDAFAGFSSVSSISLPASCVSINGLHLSASAYGTSQENLLLKPDKPIKSDKSWGLVMNVTNSGATFNQWGSGLLATGDNALANSYNGGFQLYLNAAGRIVVKTGSQEHTGLTATAGKKFVITTTFDASAKKLTITLTPESGSSSSITIDNCSLSPITEFATSIPTGVNIESLTVFPSDDTLRPFGKCSGLTDFTVESGNPVFSSVNGKLMSTDGSLLVAYPEGRLFRSFRLCSDGKAVYSAPGSDANGEIIDKTRQVLCAANALNGPTSLWRLIPVDEHIKVMHLNSQRFFGGKDGSHDRIELPVSATQWHGEYDYSWRADNADCMLTLSLPSNGLYVTTDGNYARLQSTPTEFLVADESEILLKEPVNVVALPLTVIAPAKAYTIKDIDNDTLLTEPITEGTEIPAGTGFIVIGQTTVTPSTDESESLGQTNYLTGTLLSRNGMTAGNFFTYDAASRTFKRSSKTTVSSNSAFISASAFGNPIAAETLKVDILDNSAIDDITVSNSKAVEYYNISGRKATHGLLIGTDGSKSIH